MMKKKILLIGAALLFSQAAISSDNEKTGQVLIYDLYSEGEDVGDVTLKLSQQEHGYSIIEHSHIKASGWWWTLDIITVTSEEFDNKQKLLKSDAKTFTANNCRRC